MLSKNELDLLAIHQIFKDSLPDPNECPNDMYRVAFLDGNFDDKYITFEKVRYFDVLKRVYSFMWVPKYNFL